MDRMLLERDRARWWYMAIKPAYVKKTARLLMERYPEAFSEDFERNKELVQELTNIESKSVRNRVAGYVTSKQGTAAAEA
jgi:small subunit ribosomal protein S17e